MDAEQIFKDATEAVVSVATQVADGATSVAHQVADGATTVADKFADGAKDAADKVGGECHLTERVGGTMVPLRAQAPVLLFAY